MFKILNIGREENKVFQRRIDAIREELARIERDMEDMCLDIQESKRPRRRGLPWTTDEKKAVTDAFDCLTNSLAMKFERSKTGITVFISNYISRELQIEKGE